jgi:hypothetical protein
MTLRSRDVRGFGVTKEREPENERRARACNIFPFTLHHESFIPPQLSDHSSEQLQLHCSPFCHSGNGLA